MCRENCKTVACLIEIRFFACWQPRNCFSKTESNRMMYEARWSRARYLVVNGNEPLKVKVKYVSITYRVRFQFKGKAFQSWKINKDYRKVEIRSNSQKIYEKYCSSQQRPWIYDLGKLINWNRWTNQIEENTKSFDKSGKLGEFLIRIQRDCKGFKMFLGDFGRILEEFYGNIWKIFAIFKKNSKYLISHNWCDIFIVEFSAWFVSSSRFTVCCK